MAIANFGFLWTKRFSAYPRLTDLTKTAYRKCTGLQEKRGKLQTMTRIHYKKTPPPPNAVCQVSCFSSFLGPLLQSRLHPGPPLLPRLINRQQLQCYLMWKPFAVVRNKSLMIKLH